MQAQLSAAHRAWLERLAGLAHERGVALYLAGGFVRDLLLGLRPDDFDLVAEDHAPALARAAVSRWGGDLTVHAPFGTAAWIAPDGLEFDFASARTETYPQPAALPVVHTPATIHDDLRRRDFTINAMAVRVNGAHAGELLDPFHGQADLEARVVRVLHTRSFQDDPTRVFRAVRYEQRLGFHIAPETLALLPGAWDVLSVLTADRLRREFELIFRETQVTAMLARLQALDVLAHVHPALTWNERDAADAACVPQLPWQAWRLPSAPEPDALYLALLLRDSGEDHAGVAAALTQLNVGRAVEQAVLEAMRLEKTWSRPSEAVAVLDGLSELGVITAYVAQPALRPDLHAYLARWRYIRAATTGDDLIARGLPPGPHFKQLLWALRAARLDGDITDLAGEQALLERLAR